MIVRIRFGRGASVSRRAGKNGRVAVGLGSVATLAAVSCGTLGCWRIGHDLGWTGDFAFSSGLLSHSQVWLAAAGVLQYAAWRLGRYGRAARQSEGTKNKAVAAQDRVEAAANS